MVDLILALSLAATCPDTKVINSSDLQWTPQDNKIYKLNVGFCKRKTPKNPCVKTFIKTGYNRYHIVCGGKRNGNKSKSLHDNAIRITH